MGVTHMRELLGAVEWSLQHVPIGLEVRSGDGSAGLLGLGLRDNPRRAHLLVNSALAKHVPVHPSVAVDAAGSLARSILTGLDCGQGPDLVIGFAETATGLAWLTARALAERMSRATIDYIHSTRVARGQDIDASGIINFCEPHSHAPHHEVQPHARRHLSGRRHIVLVDDEVTSGATALNLVEQLRKWNPDCRFTLACLVDARPRERVVAPTATRIRGLSVNVRSVARVSVSVAQDCADVAQSLIAHLPVPAFAPECVSLGLVPLVLNIRLNDALPRHGVSVGLGSYLAVADEILRAIGSRIDEVAHVWVLGIEEEIALPVVIAERLASRYAGLDVRVSSTTRSPAVVVDDPAYPLRSVVSYEGVRGERRFAYNLVHDADVVIVIPDGADGVPIELLDQLPGQVFVVRWSGT